MKIKTSFAIAIASFLALGGNAMAAAHHRSADRSATRQPNLYGARTQMPLDAYAYGPNLLRGRSDVSASEPGFNPALDRAKGGL